jgi:hypothetical protein
VAGRLAHREESHQQEGGCDHEGRQASRIGRDRDVPASMRPPTPRHEPCRAGRRRDRLVVTCTEIARCASRSGRGRWPGPLAEDGARPARVCRGRRDLAAKSRGRSVTGPAGGTVRIGCGADDGPAALIAPWSGRSPQSSLETLAGKLGRPLEIGLAPISSEEYHGRGMRPPGAPPPDS